MMIMGKLKWGLIGIAIICAVLIFLTQQSIFPPEKMPPANLLPFFIFLSFWDALAFGVGVALLIYVIMEYPKWPKQLRAPLLVMSFIGLWFLLLNWVHNGLHMSGFATDANFPGLAITEYLFHFPWLIFGVLLI